MPDMRDVRPGVTALRWDAEGQVCDGWKLKLSPDIPSCREYMGLSVQADKDQSALCREGPG